MYGLNFRPLRNAIKGLACTQTSTHLRMQLKIWLTKSCLHLASFPSPAQLSATCSTEKRGDWAWCNKKIMKICRTNRLRSCIFNWLHAQHSVCKTVASRLPGTLALFAVLGPVCPRTIKLFLPSFLSWCHSRKKRNQALSRFTVLEATESWPGPGNKASVHLRKFLALHRY